MSQFVYLIAEGVHDVAFLGKLMAVVHGAKRIKRLEELTGFLHDWLEDGFAWPRKVGGLHDIERLSVPAPVLYRLGSDDIVVLRNAQGITEIGRTLEVDLEAFSRAHDGPRSIGVVLDSDDEDPGRRFAKLQNTLAALKLDAPTAVGSVTTGVPRVGVFALPAPSVPGTLEDVLLALGDVAYPELAAAARGHAEHWRTVADGNPTASDWKEIRKPAGAKKAAISAMTAVLKPGKSTPASLEDNGWVSDQTKALACLTPTLAFLDALFAPTAPAPASAAAPSLTTSP